MQYLAYSEDYDTVLVLILRRMFCRIFFYLLIGYIYIGKEIAEYKLIENKLMETLTRLRAIE